MSHAMHTVQRDGEEKIWKALETAAMNFWKVLSSPVPHISMHTDFKEICPCGYGYLSFIIGYIRCLVQDKA